MADTDCQIGPKQEGIARPFFLPRSTTVAKALIGHGARTSGIAEKHHKAKIHVALLVAMEECSARVRSGEVDLSCAIGRYNDNVFSQAGHGFSVEACHLEGVPVEMDGVIIGALVPHDQAVAPALLQHHSVGLRIGLSVDSPVVEVAVPAES
jgi:hypothetical protein